MRLIWFGKISLENGKLVITVTTKSNPTLKQLLARVNKENLHDEFDTGLIIGGEVW
jgi:antitoxin component of MazEF toxin-antitoxin module